MVVTVKKSIAQDISRWLRKNGSHVVDLLRGFRGLYMYLRIVSSQGGSYWRKISVSLILSALHSVFSLLSWQITLCISLEIGGRPPFLHDFHRQKQRKAAVCHFLTVAGCIRWARSSHLSKDFERITQSRRKPAVKRGRGRFFEAIACLQATSWLSAARSLAASTTLGQKIAHRNIRAYRNISPTQASTWQRLVRRVLMAFMLPG